MTLDVYPAFMKGKEVVHADNWDPESTLNMAYGNFYQMVETMGISRMAVVPGHMTVKAMKLALATAPQTRYTERLKKICAIADIKRAPIIAFA